jgi:DNA-binding NarL/FixJ family response regulator
MRVVVVGSVAERSRLREQLNGSVEVVGEFPTLAAAREARIDADAIVVPSINPQSSIRNPQYSEALTAREIQVLELLAEGLPNKAIAARLGISDQTVKFHVAAISGKLGASNRTDAVRRAVRRGLVTL